MITAAFSGSTEVAEELLSYFVDIGNKESVEINIRANLLLPNKAPLHNQF